MAVLRYKQDGYWNRDEGRGRIPVYAGNVYVMATDDDFSGTVSGDFKYIGTDEYIIVPETIKGVTITNCFMMFTGTTSAKGVCVQSSYITDMSYMFYQSTMTTMEIFNWNVPNNLTTYSMFLQCVNLVSIDLSGIDTISVTRTELMFAGCTSLLALDVSSFNTSNVENMDKMFYSCELIVTLDLSMFDTSSVTTMTNLCYNCISLESIDVSTWDTSNVIYIGGLFDYNESLLSVDVSSFDILNAETIGFMFYGCSALTELDLSSFDTSNSVDTYNAFTNCDNIVTAYANNVADADWFNASTGKPTTFTFVVKP